MSKRCANCGTTEVPCDTVVIDWRTEVMCDPCVSSFDWTGWAFDPVQNIYTREPSLSRKRSAQLTPAR